MNVSKTNTMLAKALCVLFLVLLVNFDVSEAQFEDCRCKCVCPGNSGSRHKVNVTVVSVPALECNCEHVTGKSEVECLRCECRYEIRSTMIIKIVVIFVLVVIAILLAYLIALLILDPGMLRRTKPDGRRIMPETDTSDTAVQSPSLVQRLSRFGSAQRRWKHKVKQQRHNVFEDHTILS